MSAPTLTGQLSGSVVSGDRAGSSGGPAPTDVTEVPHPDGSGGWSWGAEAGGGVIATASAYLMPSGGDDSAAMQTALTSFAPFASPVIVLGPGIFKWNTAVPSFLVNTPARVVGAGVDKTIIKLSASAPRAFDFTKGADHDLFQGVEITDLTVDCNNLTSGAHVIAGNFVGGTAGSNYRFDNIAFRRLKTINVPATQHVGSHRISICLTSHQGNFEATQDWITNITCEDITCTGGDGGINITSSNTAGGYQTNVFFDQIKLARCTWDPGIVPTGLYTSTGFHVVDNGFAWRVRVDDCHVFNSGDDGYELNGIADLQVTGCTSTDSWDEGFYAPTYQPHTITSTGTGGTFTLNGATINWNSTAAAAQTALQATALGADVTVIGGPLNTTPLVIKFAGSHSGPQAKLTIDNTLLTGGTAVYAADSVCGPVWHSGAAGSAVRGGVTRQVQVWTNCRDYLTQALTGVHNHRAFMVGDPNSSIAGPLGTVIYNGCSAIKDNSVLVLQSGLGLYCDRVQIQKLTVTDFTTDDVGGVENRGGTRTPSSIWIWTLGASNVTLEKIRQKVVATISGATTYQWQGILLDNSTNVVSGVLDATIDGHQVDYNITGNAAQGQGMMLGFGKVGSASPSVNAVIRRAIPIQWLGDTTPRPIQFGSSASVANRVDLEACDFTNLPSGGANVFFAGAGGSGKVFADWANNWSAAGAPSGVTQQLAGVGGTTLNVKVLSADVGPLVSQTTLQPVTGLFVPIGSSSTEIWLAKFWLLINTANTTMDVKLGWTVPTSCTLRGGPDTGGGQSSFPGWGTTALATTPSALGIESTVHALGGPSAGIMGVLMAAIIFGGGTAGNVQLTYAQNTSDGGNLKIAKGSCVEYVQLAA